MNVFWDKEVCAPIIPSQKNKSCRNYWKLKTAMIYMFFTNVCKLLTTTVYSSERQEGYLWRGKMGHGHPAMAAHCKKRQKTNKSSPVILSALTEAVEFVENLYEGQVIQWGYWACGS